MIDLIETIVYAQFIKDAEYYDNLNGYERYLEWRQLAVTNDHHGDCVWLPTSCERCRYEYYFQLAKHIARILYDKGYTQGGKIWEGRDLVEQQKKGEK
jgi:hypothetical protein